MFPIQCVTFMELRLQVIFTKNRILQWKILDFESYILQQSRPYVNKSVVLACYTNQIEKFFMYVRL